MILLTDLRFWELILLPFSFFLFTVVFTWLYINYIVWPEERQKRSEKRIGIAKDNIMLELALRALEKSDPPSCEEILSWLDNDWRIKES